MIYEQVRVGGNLAVDGDVQREAERVLDVDVGGDHLAHLGRRRRRVDVDAHAPAVRYLDVQVHRTQALCRLQRQMHHYTSVNSTFV